MFRSTDLVIADTTNSPTNCSGQLTQSRLPRLLLCTPRQKTTRQKRSCTRPSLDSHIMQELNTTLGAAKSARLPTPRQTAACERPATPKHCVLSNQGCCSGSYHSAY